VVAVILHEGKFLAIERAPSVPRSGYWAPPSGGIEPGESQAEAVAREVAEEVGLAVTPIAKVWECPTDDGRFTLHWWTARATSGELRLAPAEVSAARWVTPAEFLALAPTFEGDRDFVANVLPRFID
jgi:8-oxo-dGTP diphosphatase